MDLSAFILVGAISCTFYISANRKPLIIAARVFRAVTAVLPTAGTGPATQTAQGKRYYHVTKLR